jgi:hypothetical protein
MAPPPVDESHWLLRLTPLQWLAAAQNELKQCEAALAEGTANKGMVLARRAAGMALNAVLVLRPNDSWKRSYMEHVEAVARGDGVTPEVAAAANELADRKAQPLIRLGGGTSPGPARAAGVVLAWCEAEVQRLQA